MLAAPLSRWRHLKHFLFSLIALCTSSFHHQVSFPSCLPPLLTPSTSEATFRTHVAIFSHMSSVSSPSSQDPSPSILKRLRRFPSKLPPLRFHNLGTFVPVDTYPKTKVHHHKLVLRDNTLPRYHPTI